MEEWTKLPDNWLVQSKYRWLDFGFEHCLDLRHMPCYEGTMLVHCLFSAELIKCCSCNSILNINEKEFEGLKFAS